MRILGRKAGNINSWKCYFCQRGPSAFVKPKRDLHRSYHPAQENLSTSSLPTRSTRKIEHGKLPNLPARTRFAPSPTGYLHLGSIRTALYNYLLAKATGGQFLLRIEDTDQRRTIPGGEERICKDLEWAGLQWDEGPEVDGPYGPYRQSERTALYRKHANLLIQSNNAYRCFCSQERLDSLAKERAALGLPAHYDRSCFGISSSESSERAAQGEKYVVRLKTPKGYPEYFDLVYGRVGRPKSWSRGSTVFDDPVLLKSDGSPTYHLANVVDDYNMKITHVIRGVEWMPSTPLHLELYRAFDWEPPAFAHVGLLQGKGGQKLSKRDFELNKELSLNLEALKNDGIFPEALLNFVALLGWSHSMSSDFFTKQQLIDNFTLKFTKGNAVVNAPKLKHLQSLHFRRCVEEGGARFEGVVDQILALVERDLKPSTNLDIFNGRTLREYIIALLKINIGRDPTAQIFYEHHKHLFGTYSGRSYQLHDLFPDTYSLDDIRSIANAADQLADIPETDWTAETIQQKINSIAKDVDTHVQGIESKSSYGDLLHWLRWALVQGHPGMSMFKWMELSGPRVTMDRLKMAQELLISGEDLRHPIEETKTAMFQDSQP